jgi:hypothetical protein
LKICEYAFSKTLGTAPKIVGFTSSISEINFPIDDANATLNPYDICPYNPKTLAAECANGYFNNYNTKNENPKSSANNWFVLFADFIMDRILKCDIMAPFGLPVVLIL